MDTTTETKPTAADSGSEESLRRYLIPAGMIAAVVIAAIALVSLFTGEPEIQVLGFDGPHYESVDELAKASEITVTATIGEVVRSFDDPLPGEDAPLQEMEVLKLETDDLAEPSFIVRSNYGENVIVEGAATLKTGEDVVLFLSELDRSEKRGSEAFQAGIADIDGRIFVLIGEEQGVFDIVDGQATPRDAELLTELGVLSLEELTTVER